MTALEPREVLLLAFAVMARFRCKKIAHKPDAHSWSVEQDFLSGVESALKLSGREFPEIIREYQRRRKSITTITAAEVLA